MYTGVYAQYGVLLPKVAAVLSKVRRQGSGRLTLSIIATARLGMTDPWVCWTAMTFEVVLTLRRSEAIGVNAPKARACSMALSPAFSGGIARCALGVGDSSETPDT